MSEAGPELKSGLVKWFDKDKGYGFISIAGSDKDIFMHNNQLRKSGIHRHLETGEAVTFQIEDGPKGSYAVNIAFQVETGPKAK